VPGIPDVEVHLFAAARVAAGSSLLRASPGTLGEVIEQLVVMAPGLAQVLPRCSYLQDGVAARPSNLGAQIAAGSRLDVLPPFAGG